MTAYTISHTICVSCMDWASIVRASSGEHLQTSLLCWKPKSRRMQIRHMLDCSHVLDCFLTSLDLMLDVHDR